MSGFHLPKELIEVEGPLQWINKAVSSGVAHLIDDTKHDFQKVAEILGKNICGTIIQYECPVDREEFHHNIPQILRNTFNQLNSAALYGCAGQFDKSYAILDSVESTCDKLEGSDLEGVRNAVYYTVQVLRWSISVMIKGSNQSSPVEAGTLSTVNSVKDFNGKWKDFGKHKRTIATLEYLKMKLDVSLGVYERFNNEYKDSFVKNQKPQIETFRTIIEMDPDYYLWHYYLCTAAGGVRKMAEMRDEVILPPGDVEKQACSKSFALNEDILPNLNMKICLLQETIWARPIHVYFDETETASNDDIHFCPEFKDVYDKCLELYGKALDTTRGKMQHEHAKVEFERAEFIFKVSEMKELKKKQKLIKLAVQQKPTNFIALLDYIEFLKRHPYEKSEKYMDLLTMINTALLAGKGCKYEHEGDLLILKGLVVWFYDPEKSRCYGRYREAINIWVDGAMKEFPDAVKKFKEYMEYIPFTRYGERGKKQECIFDLCEFSKLLKSDEFERVENQINKKYLQVIYPILFNGAEYIELPPEEDVGAKNQTNKTKTKKGKPKRQTLSKNSNTGSSSNNCRS